MNDITREQLSRRGLYDRLLSTEEAAAATGLSQYELRKGEKEGRYPVILIGSPGNKFRKKYNKCYLKNLTVSPHRIFHVWTSAQKRDKMYKKLLSERSSNYGKSNCYHSDGK